MTDPWCPFAERHPIVGHEDGAGPMLGGAEKIVHHTTEGLTLVGAVATYAKTGDLPHFTDTFEDGAYRVVQHLPLDVAATALKHPNGTGETNRNNAWQIEHVGFTATSATWPAEYLDGIGRLCRWIESQTNTMRAAMAPFAAGARRLTWAEWNGTSGHCGHLHVPYNDHVDPGAMDIRRVLAVVPPAPPAPPSAPIVLPGEDVPTKQLTVNVGPLGEHGEGAGLFDGGATNHAGIQHFEAVPWDTVRCVEVQGSFPPDDGYWPLPRVGRQNRDGWLAVEILGGEAHQAGCNLIITIVE